jgi:hypothetical protein
LSTSPSNNNLIAGFISVDQCAENWGVTPNLVRYLLRGEKNGGKCRIEGAIKLGAMWMIPADAPNPERQRPGPKRA